MVNLVIGLDDEVIIKTAESQAITFLACLKIGNFHFEHLTRKIILRRA